MEGLEYSTSIILISSFLSLIVLLCFKYLLFRPKQKLPPTPPSLPIVGHLHLVKRPFHRFYHSLSQKYGPVFSLRFGSRRIVVVSSSTAAEECFTKNDIVLANRPKSLSGKYIAYNWTTIGTSSYGDYWRNLRRISAIEIFSSARLNAFVSIRSDEVRQLLMKLGRNEAEFVKVELTSMFNELAFNNIMRMVAGKRYLGSEDGATDQGEAKEFRELIKEFFAIAGISHPGNYLPILNWIGGMSYINKLKHISKRIDGFFQKLIDEAQVKGHENTTMIHHLLSLQQNDPHYYTGQLIKGLILVMLSAGTDTTAATIEWAMSNLLNNPDALNKAKAELDSQIGQENLIDESDISKLPYLQSIIFETFRLNPAAPLLLPHMASSNCTICGYDVPRDTIVVINAWAIHRDPELWEDPTSFKPERFENGELGESSKLMPFGLGRRACPGAGLARRMVDLTLGSLIQCFEWERVGEKEVDMAERSGVTMPRLVPLEAMCKARPIVNKTFIGTI